MELLIERGFYSDQRIYISGMTVKTHKYILCRLAKKFLSNEVTFTGKYDRYFVNKMILWFYEFKQFPDFDNIYSLQEAYNFCKAYNLLFKYTDAAYTAINNLYKIQYESINNGILIKTNQQKYAALGKCMLKNISDNYIEIEPTVTDPSFDAVYITYEKLLALKKGGVPRKTKINVRYNNLIVNKKGKLVINSYGTSDGKINYFDIPKIVKIIACLELPEYIDISAIVTGYLGELMLSKQTNEFLTKEKIIHKIKFI
jgi:hypothetical protein